MSSCDPGSPQEDEAGEPSLVHSQCGLHRLLTKPGLRLNSGTLSQNKQGINIINKAIWALGTVDK